MLGARMHFRLGGWRAIGIVASVLWALGIYVVTFQAEDNKALRRYLAAYTVCLQDSDYDACMEKPRETWNDSAQESHERAVFTSLVTMPSGWLVAYMTFGVWRRVRRNFALPL